MKTKIILPIITILAIILIASCQKYEVVPYETKIKYIIRGDDTTEFFYDYNGRLNRMKVRGGVFEFNYKNNYILQSFQDDSNYITKSKLIPDENGYIVERKLGIEDNSPSFHYQYDNNGYLTQVYNREDLLFMYVVENGNIIKRLSYGVEDENSVYISYTDTLNKFNYLRPYGIYRYDGLNFFGKPTRNLIKETVQQYESIEDDTPTYNVEKYRYNLIDGKISEIFIDDYNRFGLDSLEYLNTVSLKIIYY